MGWLPFCNIAFPLLIKNDKCYNPSYGAAYMKPITNENRNLIVSARERGEKPGVIAVWFGVGVSTVYNILALHKKTNNITPKPFPGRPSRLTAEDLAKIRATIQYKNDITLEELIDELDLPIKKSRLAEIINGMNLPFKKRRSIQTDNYARTYKKSEKSSKKVSQN
jgi:transposase